MIHSSKDKLIVIDGLNDFIVVDRENVLLICKKENEQLIKKYMKDAKEKKEINTFRHLTFELKNMEEFKNNIQEQNPKKGLIRQFFQLIRNALFY